MRAAADADGPASSLSHYLAPLAPWLDDAPLTEFCINAPHEAFLESSRGWTRVALPFASRAWCEQFARLIAAHSQQHVSAERPLLSASLPGGERVQVVLPPAAGEVAIAIRRPSAVAYTLGTLKAQGVFDACRAAGEGDRATPELVDAYRAQDWGVFLSHAVRAKQNILVSGATGSGKTTLTKALLREIPVDERLITLEDAQELTLPLHPNAVRLYYSKDAQGRAQVTPKQLLEACLRLRPDRILLAELRGEEAYAYLRNVNSGHPGSITSIHAGSCALALEQLTLLVKESPVARDLTREHLVSLTRQTVDVVVQCARVGATRGVQEVWWKGASP